MKYKKLIIILTIVSAWFSSCSKKELIIYSNAQSGLRMRSQPNLNSEKITIFPYKERALVLEKSNELVEIDGQHNYWYKIKYLFNTGWVFGAYISFIHPNELKPGANSFTGITYINLLPDFKLISSKTISESVDFNVYQDKKNNYYGFLEK